MWYKSGVAKIVYSVDKRLKLVQLEFCGLQRMVGDGTDTWMALWNVMEEGKEFAFKSTVSEKSLRLAGYFAPNPTGYKNGEMFNPFESTMIWYE